MSNLLFITYRMAGPPKGGRAMLTRLHYRCLQQLLGDRLKLEELDPVKVTGLRGRLAALRGRIDGVSAETERRIVERIRAEGIERVLLDGSNLGRLARAIKRAVPKTEVFAFFCNVESRFFWGSLKVERSLHALGVLIANLVAERMAVRFSDRLIALSRRDSRVLKRLYGREATDILPLALEDQLDVGSRKHVAQRDEYLLFVGGAFYGNEAGIRWFADRIAPRVAIKTCIVGRGFETRRDELQRRGNVQVVGAVDRLDDWYLDAKAVVAPILDGSGMKTKVAEALMFGKKIVGTREAFAGYEAVAEQAGWICNDEQEFLAAIRSIEGRKLPRFDPALRALYERHYSFDAAKRQFAEILG
jgi:glycosyltransferase involved in cell wall biosynthesis